MGLAGPNDGGHADRFVQGTVTNTCFRLGGSYEEVVDRKAGTRAETETYIVGAL